MHNHESRNVIHGIARLCIVAALLACSSAQIAPPTTGLTGTITRGPVTPVCRVDIPCSAPFVGTFSVLQGTTTVATFRSDSAGRFTVMLSPGTYTVLPADASMMGPSRQGQSVNVGPVGLTTVQIEFDTGIR